MNNWEKEEVLVKFRKATEGFTEVEFDRNLKCVRVTDERCTPKKVCLEVQDIEFMLDKALELFKGVD